MLNKRQELKMVQVNIKNGTYRNAPVVNTSFPLIKGFQTGAKGGFVTVDGSAVFGAERNNIRIKVDGIDSYEIVGGGHATDHETSVVSKEPVKTETDEEVIERIRTRFQILDEMAQAAVDGNIRAMIVSGPPGVGKSYGVEQEIEKATLFDRLAGKRLRAEVVKGTASPIGLYQTLYKDSDENCVLVFDDCDSILLDDVCLNLLKGALDSSKKRKISWLSESSTLRREGIPDQFDFKGSVIFITNLKFDKMKSQKLRDHLDALQSRCHYLDLTLDTMRDKILRIKQIAKDGVLFEGYDFEPETQDSIFEFMETNQTRLREMSLRMALKIADLRKLSPGNWKRLSETTCMKAAD